MDPNQENPTPVPSTDPVAPAPEAAPSVSPTPEATPDTSFGAPAPEVTPAPVSNPVVSPVAEAPAPVAAAPVSGVENPGKTLGLVSLILSLVGGGLIAVILGVIGVNKSKKAGQKNPLGLAGIIIGSIATVVGLIIAISLFSAAAGLLAQCADLGAGTHVVDGVAITCEV